MQVQRQSDGGEVLGWICECFEFDNRDATMKTPMQQLLEELKHYQATFQNPIGPIIEKIENELIERERVAIVSAFAWGNITKVQYKSQHIAGEDYYNDRYESNT
jgi:hypothetical protein